MKERNCTITDTESGKLLWGYDGDCKACPNTTCEFNPNQAKKDDGRH